MLMPRKVTSEVLASAVIFTIEHIVYLIRALPSSSIQLTNLEFNGCLNHDIKFKSKVIYKIDELFKIAATLTLVGGPNVQYNLIVNSGVITGFEIVHHRYNRSKATFSKLYPNITDAVITTHEVNEFVKDYICKPVDHPEAL